MIVWRVLARRVLLPLLVCIVRDMGRGRLARSLWRLAPVPAGCVPYGVVFAYQRHLVPLPIMAGLLRVVLYLGKPRARESLAGIDRVGESAGVADRTAA